MPHSSSNEFKSLYEHYDLPTDIPRMIAYGRTCVIEHLGAHAGEPERHLDEFCQELKTVPRFISHFQKDEDEDDDPQDKITPEGYRHLFLMAVIGHARLYAWFDYYVQQGYTPHALVGVCVACKQNTGEKNFGPTYEELEKSIGACNTALLAQELSALLETVARDGEDRGKSLDALMQMKLFSTHWWLARPEIPPAKPAKAAPAPK